MQKISTVSSRRSLRQSPMVWAWAWPSAGRSWKVMVGVFRCPPVSPMDRSFRYCCRPVPSTRDDEDGNGAVDFPRARREMRGVVSGKHLDDTHHALILVVDGVAVIDETTDDCRVGEGDHDFQHARPVIRRRRHREGISQAALVLTGAVDLGDQERSLMDVK